MAITSTVNGTRDSDFIVGEKIYEQIFGRNGDDSIFGRSGWDDLFGGNGFDNLYGGLGEDDLFGGTQNDDLYGGNGSDTLHGDGGRATVKGSDLASDYLVGGNGADTLYQGDGNDTMTGGEGADNFVFKWQDPMVGLAVATGRSFTNITDFDADDDRLVFDAAGVGKDSAGANFVDGGDGTVGGEAATFFTGAAEDSAGEAVMILDEAGFASGADAVLAAQEEELGDFVLYFNTTVGVGSLLFVDALDTAHSIARFSNIDTLDDLASADFTAGDFVFA